VDRYAIQRLALQSVVTRIFLVTLGVGRRSHPLQSRKHCRGSLRGPTLRVRSLHDSFL